MKFTSGTQVYVRYETEVTSTELEKLTIRTHKNNLLYFEEKSDYYAVECNNASFYGYSYTFAGSVIVVKHKWQIAFALLAEKIRTLITVPANKTINKHKPEPMFMKNLARQ